MINLRVQHIVQRTMGLICVRALERPGKVFAVRPIRLFAQLCLHSLEETQIQAAARPETPISSANINQFYCLANILPCLSRISKLQEVAGSESLPGAGFSRAFAICSSRVPLSIAIKIVLRSRLGAHPDLGATGPAQSTYVTHGHRAATRDCILKGMAAGDFSTSAASSQNHLARRPKMSSANRRCTAPKSYFNCRISSATLFADRTTKRRPYDRLSAPIATVGAAAADDDIQGEIAVSGFPSGTMLIDIDQIASRKRQQMKITHQGAVAGADEFSSFLIQQCKPRNPWQSVAFPFKRW